MGGVDAEKRNFRVFAAIGMPIIVGYGLSETCATVTAYPTVNFVHGSVGVPLPGVEIKNRRRK